MTSDSSPPTTSFEAICALPGFCSLEKRSPTLGGSLPLRAAQHCSPVFEGNSVGFQVVLKQPMTVRRFRGALKVELTPPAFQQTQEEVTDAVERLVAEGILPRGGYWHRLLRRDALPIAGNRLLIWTGFLIKPPQDAWLRVGRAFNRACRIDVIDHLIDDPTGFTPLIVEVDGRSIGRDAVWLEGEVGSLLPVSPNVTIDLAQMPPDSPVVRSYEAFFDAHFFAEKEKHPTGKYRKMFRDKTSEEPEPSPACHARMFFVGPAVHKIRRLNRRFTPAGVSQAGPQHHGGLPFAEIANVGQIGADWDGQSFRPRVEFGSALRALERSWRRAGGNTDSDAFEVLRNYAADSARDEPYWGIHAWAFLVTSAGWSAVTEGTRIGHSEGMRGVLRTDAFHGLSMVYRLYAPGPVQVDRGTVIMRATPIPRRLQAAGLIDVSASSGAQIEDSFSEERLN